MLAVTCDKCRRRFSVTDEELQGYLAQSEGKKFGLVLCPHCGKGNKVAHVRMAQALGGATAPKAQAAPAEQAPAGQAPAPGQDSQD
jgi:hypothetical protein